MIFIKKLQRSSISALMIVLALCTLAASEAQAVRTTRSTSTPVSKTHKAHSKQTKQKRAKTAKRARIVHAKAEPQVQRSEHVFTSLRRNFNNKNASQAQNHHEVQKQVATLNRSRKTLIRNTIKATPHLQYVIGQVEKRNLPAELALVPMIESGFKQNVTSNRGAAGIWQIMPATARRWGIKTTEGRRDVKTSTNAALNYLEYLNRRYRGDWMLTLAAYNAGEGTVDRAIKRNRSAGRPTTFWHLKLPKQTRAYVPKLLALTQILKSEIS